MSMHGNALAASDDSGGVSRGPDHCDGLEHGSGGIGKIFDSTASMNRRGRKGITGLRRSEVTGRALGDRYQLSRSSSH